MFSAYLREILSRNSPGTTVPLTDYAAAFLRRCETNHNAMREWASAQTTRFDVAKATDYPDRVGDEVGNTQET